MIPALKPGAGKNQPAEYAPGEEFNEEEAANGEPIPGNLMAQAQPLIDVFGEPLMRKVFSKTWTLREQGITEVEEEILRGRHPNQAEIFIGAVGVVRATIGDKIVSVASRSI